MDEFEDIKQVIKEHAKKEGKGVYRTANVSSNLNWLRIKRQIKEVCRYIPKNAKVLDLGCGRGHNTLMLKLSRPDIKIIGISPISSNQWKIYKRKNCVFRIGNGLNMEFKNNTFDVVVSFGVMEHLREDYVRNFGKREFRNEELKFMQEVFRVLKPKGVSIVANLPNKYSWSEFLTRLLKLRFHINRYTKKQIENLMKNAGFKDVKIRREFFIPAQVYKVSKFGAKFLNKYYRFFDNIDRLLNKTPLNIFSQSYFIICKK